MRASKIQWIATLLSCGVVLTPVSSWACGGCFHPIQQSASSAVTGHRMAFAVSDERTVLWDQFEYSGAPDDFSWVLPVLPGAYLEESTDAWFETLETVTQTRVTSPAILCAQPDSGGGCLGAMGAADSATSGRGGFYDNGVMVLHRGTVGPYQTVTLRSTNGDALSEWLSTNGYFIPPDIAPTIAAYVSEGADFVAVRLQPGLGVQQMTPVRVVTPGGEYLLPLRMVAAGIGESVNIVLYVIGEQRYAMPDLHEVAVDSDAIVWKFADGSSNYAELRRQALARNLGFSYLPSFAARGVFGGVLPGPSGSQTLYATSNGGQSYNNFSDLYFAQALANDGETNGSCPSIDSRLQGINLVSEQGETGSVSAAGFACGDYTDLSAAMIGMHPAKVWLTRLELDLPKEALSMDCVVVPEATQAEVSNQLQAVHASDRPDGCPQVIFESKLARGTPARAGAWLMLAAAGVSLWLRRRGAR